MTTPTSRLKTNYKAKESLKEDIPSAEVKR